jgi:hypothetical protein
MEHTMNTAANDTAAARNAEISAAILANVARTGDVAAALDAVLGAGSYEKLAGELYEALRAKAGKRG